MQLRKMGTSYLSPVNLLVPTKKNVPKIKNVLNWKHNWHSYNNQPIGLEVCGCFIAEIVDSH